MNRETETDKKREWNVNNFYFLSKTKNGKT